MDGYNITIRDKEDKILTKEELNNKVIDCEPYYTNMELITKRINEEYNFDKVY